MVYRCILCNATAPKDGGRLPEGDDYCKEHEFAPINEPLPLKEPDAQSSANDDADDQEDTDLYKEYIPV